MKKITAIITAILISVPLVFKISGCENSEPSSENSSTSEYSSEQSTQTTTEKEPESVPEQQKPVEEPTFLKGPDGEPIYPSDITSVYIKDENAPYGKREADISELTEDNLATVYCEGFGYLRESSGIRYNRYESPDKFESEFPYRYIGEELFTQTPIKRVKVGEQICGMTVADIETMFIDMKRDDPIPFWNDSIVVKFKGEITLTGYLWVESMTPDYPGTEGAVTFWLDEQSRALPIASISNRKEGEESPYCGYVSFYTESSGLDLGSIYASGTNPASCDESLLDGITYGDRDIHVKITIDDYIAFCSGENRAVLKSLERL